MRPSDPILEENASDPETEKRETHVPHPIDTHKSTISSIVSVFETGSPSPDYSSVVVLDDGAGITYGKHQSTDRSGSLDAIIQRYIGLGGVYAAELAEYADRLDADSSALADPDGLPGWVTDLMGLLTTAATDLKMRQAQDEVFDQRYWVPARTSFDLMDLSLPLSMLVVYDSTIHGGLQTVRARFPEAPPSNGGDEQAWVKAYLIERKAWLDEIGIGWTNYRVDAMLEMVKHGNWELQTPIHIARPKATIP